MSALIRRSDVASVVEDLDSPQARKRRHVARDGYQSGYTNALRDVRAYIASVPTVLGSDEGAIGHHHIMACALDPCGEPGLTTLLTIGPLAEPASLTGAK